MSGNKEIVAKRVPFVELCKVFDKMKSSVSSSKRQHFDQFLKHWRNETITKNPDGSSEIQTSDTFYPAMRIFVPSLDTRQFGMGNHKLSQLACKSLGIEQIKAAQIPSELLVQKLLAEIQKRFTVSSHAPHLSIHEVNDYLDRMVDSDQRDRVLQELFRKCTISELHWILHVLLANVEMQLGIPHPSTILGWFHNRAYESMNAGNTLREICEELTLEEEHGGSLGSSRNLLFKPLRPMLLKRLGYDKRALPKIIKACRRPFYVETKHDGEHIILHKSGDTYKYFTRNGCDYTRQLGKDSNTRFSKYLHPFFLPTVKDCVLDCELLVWDSKKQYYLGKNRQASDGNVYDAKHLDEDFFDNANFKRALAVLDVLYLNGNSLVEETLEKRVGVLESEVLSSEDKSVVFLSRKTAISKAQDFVDYYTKAMKSGEEGIVIKGISTTYKFGSRAEKNGWFKIKPDYGIQSMLDLAVVAVRYENNSDKVKSFLVAAKEGEWESMRFRVVAGITCHLKRIDYERIMRLLTRDHELLDGYTQPVWLAGEISLGRNLKFVSRPNIQVVEVRASGVINNRLQFPSIASIRVDKRVEEIDSLREVHEFEEKIRSRPVVDEDDKHEAALLIHRKRKLQLKLKENCKLAKLDPGSESICDALKDKKVCVLNGDPSGSPSAQDLQKILLSMGAKVVANPGNDTVFVVACNEKVLKTRTAIKSNKWHVVYGAWLLECEKQKKLIPWRPSDLMYKAENASFDLCATSDKDEEEEGEEAGAKEEAEADENEAVEEDEEESSTAPALASEEAEAEGFDDEAELDQAEVDKFTSEDCESATVGNLFEGFIFYIHKSIAEPKERNDLKRSIEEQKGKISPVLGPNATHVVCKTGLSESEGEELDKWNSDEKLWAGNFATPEWVEQSISEGDRYLRCYQLFNLLAKESA